MGWRGYWILPLVSMFRYRDNLLSGQADTMVECQKSDFKNQLQRWALRRIFPRASWCPGAETLLIRWWHLSRARHPANCEHWSLIKTPSQGGWRPLDTRLTSLHISTDLDILNLHNYPEWAPVSHTPGRGHRTLVTQRPSFSIVTYIS